MARCELKLVLNQTSCPAGGKLQGHVVVNAEQPIHTKAVTVELAWRTHGKGNRARAEIARQTLFAGELESTEHLPFEFTLPNGPLTYHGVFINVEWFVRARVDLNWAIDPKAEAIFSLRPGNRADLPYEHGATLPSLGPEDGPEGSTGSTQAKPIVLILLFASVTLAVVGLQQSDFMFLLAGCAVALITAAVVFLALKRRVAERRIGAVQLNLSTFEPRPGDSIQVAVTLSPTRSITLNGVTAVLRGYERAVTGSGTRTSTHTSEFHRQQQSLMEGPQQLSPLEPGRFVTAVTIPLDAPPSFYAADNQVCWVIDVRLDLPLWPDWTNTVTLAVKAAAAA